MHTRNCTLNPAAQQEGNISKGFKYICPRNGSSKGQNLVLSVFTCQIESTCGPGKGLILPSRQQHTEHLVKFEGFVRSYFEKLRDTT